MSDRILMEWLAGEFDNKDQSKEDPAWYVPLKVWHRPLPHRIDGKLALFAEQSNLLVPDRPYRQRVLVLDHNGLAAQYWAFKNPSLFCGAGANPDLLKDALEPNLDLLPGCALDITFANNFFRAEAKPNSRCCFTYDGKVRQVVLGFEISTTQFLSHDRGVDPNTGRSLWGAMMGPYRHQKRCTYKLTFAE